jgi:3-hydroxyacyl-CoA dehydrogenase/enoyl-CoA hydratase/3-hydroxybutyryl-CoA epimerase
MGAMFNHIQTSFERGIFTIFFNQKDSKVNTLCEPVLAELEKILDEISCKIDVRAVVFKSLKENNFIAGADINEIKQIETQDDAKKKVFRGQNIISKIQNLSKCRSGTKKCLTFAMINGSCLGGGLELALACDYRIAVESEKTKLGLPEVSLGIIPGFGGCVRLPKIVGLINALPIILTGSFIDVKKAYKIGLVDEVVPVFRGDEVVELFVKKKIMDGSLPKRKCFTLQKLFKCYFV